MPRNPRQRDSSDKSEASKPIMALESVGLKLLGSVAWEALKGLRGLFKHGPGDIEKMEKKMKEILEDLEFVSNLEDPAERTEKWIVDVRELVCDIEDVISKCKHPGDKKASTEDKIKKKFDKIKERIMLTPTYFSLSGPIKHITDDASRLEDKYKKVNKVLSGGGSEYHRFLPLLNQRFDGLSLNGPKEKIISLLDIADVPATRDYNCEKSIGHMVVSIVGIGGLGKTTLAGQVYNQIAEQFECKARVFMSRNRPPKDILKDILRQFRVNYNIVDCEPITLLPHIQEHVQDKRFLVVFDDVWNDDLLESFNIALLGNQRGGRIIITTRNSDVAKKWCSFHPMESNGCCPFEGNRIYQIKPLNVEDSKILLLRKASYHSKKPQKSIGYIDKIVAKCGGSPLALTAASDLAVQQGSTICWNKVYESMNKINGDLKIQRMRVDLSHSYFDLPYRQRECLLYLSLFPNDEINKKRLMSRWFAEGLIDENKCKTTFKDLVDRNLILQPEIKYDGDESIYQMHRTIHDFVVWKSAKYNFITLPSAIDQTDLKKIRRISVHKNTEGCGDIKLSAKKFSHLRSLSIHGPGDLPLEMSSTLRVLDLEDCNNGCLKPGELFNHNLKYLKIGEGLKGFECNKVMENYLLMRGMEEFLSPDKFKPYVPATQDVKRIGSAKNLHTLDLRGVGRVTLDAAITDLVLLVRLLVDPETTLPHGIMKMKVLEELEFINVANYDSKFFEELVKLPKLRAMGIYVHAASSSSKDKQFLTSLLKLVRKGLRSLFIDGDRNTSFAIAQPSLWGAVVENIRKFRVRCPFSATPVSTNSHQHLERLRIGVLVTNLKEELPVLAGFSSHLTHLYLDLSGRPQDVTTFSGAEKFPHLQCLGIRSGSLNMKLKFPRGAPEHLKLQLQADDCKEPQELPVGYNYASTDVKNPREGNGNNQGATTWTAVHITTPRKENHNMEVVVDVMIVSRSATLSIRENEINSCIGRTNFGKAGTGRTQIKQEGRLDIMNNEIDALIRNTTIIARKI